MGRGKEEPVVGAGEGKEENHQDCKLKGLNELICEMSMYLSSLRYL